MPSVVGEHRMADVRVHDDVAHAVDDAGVHQHEPISLEVDALFGAQLDHRGDLPRERPAEREAESGCELPRWIVQGFSGSLLNRSLLGRVRRREFELWIHLLSRLPDWVLKYVFAIDSSTARN